MLIKLNLPDPPKRPSPVSLAYEQFINKDGSNNTPQDMELVIRVAFTDKDGNPGHAITKTSRLPPTSEQGFQELRMAVGTFYAMMGCRVASAQISMEVAKSVVGVRPRPKLRLVKG